jgi:hypothetical protein
MNKWVQAFERRPGVASGALHYTPKPTAIASTSGTTDEDNKQKIKFLSAEVERLTKKVNELERANGRSADVGVEDTSVSTPPAGRAMRSGKAKSGNGDGGDDGAGHSKKARC